MTSTFNFKTAKKDRNFYHISKSTDIKSLIVTKTAKKLVFPGHF